MPPDLICLHALNAIKGFPLEECSLDHFIPLPALEERHVGRERSTDGPSA
jgi:hypothetical protein